jgi:hypothetical protein
MSDVDVWINAAELADAFENMRTWLDHNDCIPANFDVRTDEPGRVLVVHVEFDRDDVAEAFQRDFGAADPAPPERSDFVNPPTTRNDQINWPEKA